ncbi:MAG: hypothetical protein RLZZ628_378 [Bacteroidota bacterium]|jgi:hypothetical protein
MTTLNYNQLPFLYFQNGTFYAECTILTAVAPAPQTINTSALAPPPGMVTTFSFGYVAPANTVPFGATNNVLRNGVREKGVSATLDAVKSIVILTSKNAEGFSLFTNNDEIALEFGYTTKK